MMSSWGTWLAMLRRTFRASRPLLCFLLCLLLASRVGAVPTPGAPVLYTHSGLQPWQPPPYQTSQPQPQLVASITMTLPNPSFHEEARWRYVKDPAGQWTLGMHPEASADHVQHLKEVLAQNLHVAAYSINDLPGYTGAVAPFRLDLEETPVPTRPRRHSPGDEDFAKQKVAELLDAGIVRPSSSRLYATEYAVVKKKDEDGLWTDGRMVFDLRPTNLKTKLDRYPLPTPEYLFNKLGQAKYFSTMDLRSGFHQIPIHEEDVEKTAFYCGGAKYEFTRMPFGLKNGHHHF